MFCARFVIFGSVQGVGYRSFVKRIALMSKINGYVRNLLDGTVEVVVEAKTKDEVMDFKAKLFKRAVAGSFDNISVDDIQGDINEVPKQQFSSFEVRL